MCISAKLSPQARVEFIAFLKEYANIIAWSYDDMIGLDIEVVVHTLPLKPNAMLVKKKLKRLSEGGRSSLRAMIKTPLAVRCARYSFTESMLKKYPWSSAALPVNDVPQLSI